VLVPGQTRRAGDCSRLGPFGRAERPVRDWDPARFVRRADGTLHPRHRTPYPAASERAQRLDPCAAVSSLESARGASALQDGRTSPLSLSSVGALARRILRFVVVPDAGFRTGASWGARRLAASRAGRSAVRSCIAIVRSPRAPHSRVSSEGRRPRVEPPPGSRSSPISSAADHRRHGGVPDW